MGAFISWGTSAPFKSISFDIVTQETPVKSNTITEFPVEEGANISDHIRPNLDTLTLEVFVSNTPIHGGNLLDPQGLGIDAVGFRGAMESNLASFETMQGTGTLSQVLDVPPSKPVGLGGLINAALESVRPVSATLAAPPVRTVVGMTYQGLSFPEDFNAPQETWDALEDLRVNGTLVQVISRDWALENMAITSLSEPRSAEEGTGAKFSIEFKQVRVVRTRQTTLPVSTESRAKGAVNAGAKGTTTAPDPPANSVAYSLLNGSGNTPLGSLLKPPSL